MRFLHFFTIFITATIALSNGEETIVQLSKNYIMIYDFVKTGNLTITIVAPEIIGLIGFGLNNKNSTLGMDAFIGGHYTNSTGSFTYLQDYHVSENGLVKDEHHDWYLLSDSTEVNNITVMTFTRSAISADKSGLDHDITDEKMYWFFAHHNESDTVFLPNALDVSALFGFGCEVSFSSEPIECKIAEVKINNCNGANTTNIGIFVLFVGLSSSIFLGKWSALLE